MATLSIHSLWESYNYTGDPGEGKTTMVLQIIAKLTRGKPILPASFEKRKEPERADAITDEIKQIWKYLKQAVLTTASKCNLSDSRRWAG